VEDKEMTGDRLYREVTKIASEPGALEAMSAKVRAFARAGAAQRAADLLEQLAGTYSDKRKSVVDLPEESRNNN
jgi:UDP-N-acetylglucosamine:LPS N-acetylglucosamine transferase